MIQVTKGISQTLVFTLKEKTTLTSPYYLFYCIGQGKNNVVTWIAQPTSSDDRKDQFKFIEGTTASLSEQIYNYFVYEQTSAVNTNPSLATSLVERGQMKVNDVNEQEYQLPNSTTQYHF